MRQAGVCSGGAIKASSRSPRAVPWRGHGPRPAGLGSSLLVPRSGAGSCPQGAPCPGPAPRRSGSGPGHTPAAAMQARVLALGLPTPGSKPGSAPGAGAAAGALGALARMSGGEALRAAEGAASLCRPCPCPSRPTAQALLRRPGPARRVPSPRGSRAPAPPAPAGGSPGRAGGAEARSRKGPVGERVPLARQAARAGGGPQHELGLPGGRRRWPCEGLACGGGSGAATCGPPGSGAGRCGLRVPEAGAGEGPAARAGGAVTCSAAAYEAPPGLPQAPAEQPPPARPAGPARPPPPPTGRRFYNRTTMM